MANALTKWFMSIIGDTKLPVTKPVVKDEEVLSLLAKGKKKEPVALDPFSTSDVTRQQVLESQSKVSDAFTPQVNPKMTRLREVSNDMRTAEFQDDLSETYGYDRTAVNENQLQPVELIETGEVSSALYQLDESFGGVKLESGAYKKLADFYSPLAVAIDDIKFPRKGLTLKQIKQKLGDEYGITTGTDTEFDKIFSKSNVEKYDKDTAQDLITRNAIRVEAVYMDETFPLDIMSGGIEVMNDRVNTLKKNNIFDPMIPDIDTTEGFTLGVDEALNYSKYQRPGAHRDFHHHQQRRLYLETVQKYNTSALLKGPDDPSTIALLERIDKIKFITKLDSNIKPTYATIRLKLVPHKGFEELINQYDERLLKINDGGVQHYPADTLAHARIDIVDETKLIDGDNSPSKFGFSSDGSPMDSERINTFAKWRANNPNSKLNTKYVYLTEGQSDLLQSFRLDNEELLKAFRDDKELLRYHKALMKQDLFNNPTKSRQLKKIDRFKGVPRSVVPSAAREGGNFESNLLSNTRGIKGFGNVPLSKPELHPLPAESLTAVMKQLLQATIAYAHKNNIKQIVIPSVEQIASLRDKSIFRTPSADTRRESIDNYYKKVKQGLFFQTYDTSIKSALKKLKKDNLITTFETKTPAYNEVLLPSDTSAARRIDLKTIDQHFPIKDLMKLDNIDSRGLAKFYKNREKGLGKYRVAINKLETLGESLPPMANESASIKNALEAEKLINVLEKGVREYVGLIAKLPSKLRNEFFEDDIISKNIADYRLPPNLMKLNNKDFENAIVEFIKYGTSGEGFGSQVSASGKMYGDTFKLKPRPYKLRKDIYNRLLGSTYGHSGFNNPDTVMRQLIENVKYKRENLREITQAERIGEQKALVIDISKLSEKLGKQEFVLEFNKGGLVVANLQNKGLMSKSKRVAA